MPDGLTILEWAAVIATLVNVVLVARADIRAFGPGALSAILYGLFFWQTKLYGNAALSLLYYLPMQAYGYRIWKTRGPKKDDDLKLEVRGLAALAQATVIGLLIAVPVRYLLVLLQGTATWLDAITTAVSLVAQVLLSWKWAESWPMWAGVNLVYVVLFAQMAAWPSTGLYALLFLIALWGWREWARGAAKEAARPT